MGTHDEREHLSIGEVLSLLKEEFPEVTISKIRFLESQGLVDPERTPSGYRKFYDPDVERLRWILQQQRENFLPLKVIRGRLGGDEVVGEPEVEIEAHPAPPERPSRQVASSPVALVPPPSRAQDDESMTFEELCALTGLEAERLRECEKFGLLAGRAVAGVTYYDPGAIAMARIVAGFDAHGVEPRHLKIYRNTARNEVALFEQVVTPLLKQRNPKSRRQAADTLSDLTQLAQELRALMVSQALNELGLR